MRLLDHDTIHALREIGTRNRELRGPIIALLDEVEALDGLLLDADRVLDGDGNAAARLRARFDRGSRRGGSVRRLLRAPDAPDARPLRTTRTLAGLVLGVGLAAETPGQAERMLGGLVDTFGPLTRAGVIGDALIRLQPWERDDTVPGLLAHLIKNDLLGVKPGPVPTFNPLLKCIVQGTLDAWEAAQQRPQYVIVDVKPDDANPGATATITGLRFGSGPGRVLVPQSRVNAKSDTPKPLQVTPTTWTPTKITYKVPNGAAPGELRLVVPSEPIVVCGMKFAVNRLGNSFAVHGGLIEAFSLTVKSHGYQGEPVVLAYELSPSRHAHASFSFIPVGGTITEERDGATATFGIPAPSGIAAPTGTPAKPNATLTLAPSGPAGGGPSISAGLVLQPAPTVVVDPDTKPKPGKLVIHVRASVAFVDEWRRVYDLKDLPLSQAVEQVPWDIYDSLADKSPDIRVLNLVLTRPLGSGLTNLLTSKPIPPHTPQEWAMDYVFDAPKTAWPVILAGTVDWGAQGLTNLPAPPRGTAPVNDVRDLNGQPLYPIPNPGGGLALEYTLRVAATWTAPTGWFWVVSSYS